MVSSGMLKTWWGILKDAVSDWTNDSAPRLGAAIAYYTVFAIPPLFVIVIFIASLWFDENRVRTQLMDEVGGLVGKKGADAIRSALSMANPAGTGGVASLVALGTLVLTSTGLFIELQAALNAVWSVRARGGRWFQTFLKNRLLSFALVLVIGFLLVVSLVVSAAIGAASKYVAGIVPGLDAVWLVANALVSLLVVTVLFAMIFKLLPDVRIAWRDVWVGATVTAVLFTAGKLLLGWYLGRNTAVSSYGAAGSVVLILLWVYYSAQILLFGAELTQVYANRCGARLVPKPHAEWILPGSEPAAVRVKPHALRAHDRKAELVAELRRRVDALRAAHADMGARRSVPA